MPVKKSPANRQLPKHRLGWLVLLLLAAAGLGAGLLSLRRPSDRPVDREPLAHANQAGYLGPHVCAECHEERVHSFLQTNHFRTSRLPRVGDLTGSFEPGENVYVTRTPGLSFEMTQRGDQFFQSAVQVVDGQEERRTEQIGLVYGAGTIDEVYHYWNGDRLFQLPIAYLNPIDDWCNAPNYRDGLANFSREIPPACLECHNTHVDHVAGSVNQYKRETMILGVTCERCHGPGQEHVAHHRASPDDELARHIVHPGTLTRQQELDVCLQCHSEIEVRRRPAFSFRPGEPLEDYFRTHGDRDPEDDISANQIEGLSRSACFIQTEMTCNTCHNPHIPEGPDNSASAANSCFVCHQAEQCGASETLPVDLRGECIDCHMPRKGALNFTFHTKTEDYLPLIQRREHRIAAYPDKTKELLSAWHGRQPSAESQAVAKRLRGELAREKKSEARALARDRRLRASSGSYREALRLTPDDEQLAEELSGVLSELSELVSLLRRASEHSVAGESEQAVDLLSKAVAIKPNHTSAVNGLGLAFERLGRFEEAARQYERVIEIDPEFVDAYYNLGALKQNRGRLDEAVEYYQRAVELAPLHTDARMNLGSSFFLLDRPADAAAQFRTAIEIQPRYAEAHFNLAVALRSLAEIPAAVQHLRQAIAAAPNWGIPQQQLAWILATDADPNVRAPTEAIRLAESACRTSRYKNAVHLDTLAAAYAAAGDFARALEAVDQALVLARDDADGTLASDIRNRRRLYRSRRPYRQPRVE